MSPRYLCAWSGVVLGLSAVGHAWSLPLGAAMFIVGLLGIAAGLLWPTGLRRLSDATLVEAHRWALKVGDAQGAEVLHAEWQRRRREEVGHG